VSPKKIVDTEVALEKEKADNTQDSPQRLNLKEFKDITLYFKNSDKSNHFFTCILTGKFQKLNTNTIFRYTDPVGRDYVISLLRPPLV